MTEGADGSPDNPEIVSFFEKLDFDCLWKGSEKTDTLEKTVLLHLLSISDKRRILELGTGNGRLTGTIQQYAEQYFASDINKSFLKEAKRKSERTASRKFASNLYRLPCSSGPLSGTVMIRLFNLVSRPLQVL